MKGSYLTPDMPEQINPKRVYDPPEDTTWVTLHSLTFDRNRVTYRWWRADKPEERSEAAFEGGRELRLSGTERRANEKHPHASTRWTEKFGDADLGQIAGALRPYRILNPAMGVVDADALRLSGRTGVIDGHDCVIVERTRGSPDLITEYWVAPDADYLPFRSRVMTKGVPVVVIDFRYRRDPSTGWVPSEWRGTFARQNTVSYSFESHVTRIEINPLVSPGDFSVDFPTGTVVTDAETLKSFLVREDGKRRDITPDEQMHATYEQVAASETGEALAPRRSRNWFRLVLVTGIGVAAVVFIVCWMRARRK
jgi:hypothetical protein